MRDWIGRTGFVLVVALTLFFGIQASQTLVSQSPAVGAGTGGISHSATENRVHVLSTQLSSGIQQIVVTDMAQQVMAVYHVEPAHGKVQLKSVRNLGWDLRMEEFNGQSPLPSELRALQP